jgi:hypothetical protein
MTSTRPSRRTARGTTLLEAVIALAILLIAVLGMLRLNVMGANSDEGARAYTAAVQLGHELVAGLERLEVNDPRLREHFTGDVAPAEFGHVVQPDNSLGGTFTPWSDAAPIPGTVLDADLVAGKVTDTLDPTQPRFQRRWTVWMPKTPITIDSSKVIAVSVTWRERGFAQLREVVLYGSVINAAAVTSYAGLQR